MTPDLLNALADLFASMHPGAAPASKSDAVCVALGLDADAHWSDVADAFRLHATTLTPGWPYGEAVSPLSDWRGPVARPPEVRS